MREPNSGRDRRTGATEAGSPWRRARSGSRSWGGRCEPDPIDATCRCRHPAMRHRLDDLVVVITGASSGVGRPTALAFARYRSAVVLAPAMGAVLRCPRPAAPVLLTRVPAHRRRSGPPPASVGPGSPAPASPDPFPRCAVWGRGVKHRVANRHERKTNRRRNETLQEERVRLAGELKDEHAARAHGTRIRAPMPADIAAPPIVYSSEESRRRAFRPSRRAATIRWLFVHHHSVSRAPYPCEAITRGARARGGRGLSGLISGPRRRRAGPAAR
jgi:hypothetical protein